MSDTPNQYAGLSFDDTISDIVCTHLAEWGISDRDDRINGEPVSERRQCVRMVARRCRLGREIQREGGGR